MNQIIQHYEEMSMNSHPSLQTQYYDGWLLRFSNGYTNRTNSVNMIYPSTIDIHSKVEECERQYMDKKLSCVFKVTDGSENGLDDFLEAHGYEMVTPTAVMDIKIIITIGIG